MVVCYTDCSATLRPIQFLTPWVSAGGPKAARLTRSQVMLTLPLEVHPEEALPQTQPGQLASSLSPG